MRLPHRLQGQKVKSQGGAGAYCGGDLAAQLVLIVIMCNKMRFDTLSLYIAATLVLPVQYGTHYGWICFMDSLMFVWMFAGCQVYVHWYRQDGDVSWHSSSAVEAVFTLSLQSLLIQCYLPAAALWTVLCKWTLNTRLSQKFHLSIILPWRGIVFGGDDSDADWNVKDKFDHII